MLGLLVCCAVVHAQEDAEAAAKGDIKADMKKDKTGTNPLNFTYDARIYNEYRWLNTVGDGDPNALALIHNVIVASASIPGVFPPVFIEVEAEGSRYDEMHVDGGAASQVFLVPTGLDWSRVEEKFEVKGKPRAYIIRNDHLVTDWQPVQPKLAQIAGRSINSLIRNNGYGDLYRLYLEVQQAGIDFNLAYIPSEFNIKPKEPFDPEYMGKLIDLGYRMALPGYPWKKTPPGF